MNKDVYKRIRAYNYQLSLWIGDASSIKPPTGRGVRIVCMALLVMPPTVGKGAISVAFVRPSVCPSVVHIANSSRTQRPSVPKFGRTVPHLRRDSHTSFKVKRSKFRVRGGRGIPCRPNPAATLLVSSILHYATLCQYCVFNKYWL